MNSLGLRRIIFALFSFQLKRQSLYYITLNLYLPVFPLDLNIGSKEILFHVKD